MDESKEQRWLRLYREAYGKPGVLPNHDSPMWVFAAAVERDALARPSPSEEALEALVALLAAARDVRNRYAKGDRLTKGPWVEVAVLDMAFRVYDAALSSSAPASEAKP